jgi:hypothetical protein
MVFKSENRVIDRLLSQYAELQARQPQHWRRVKMTEQFEIRPVDQQASDTAAVAANLLRTDSFPTKAMQELHLLGDGIATGFTDRAQQAITHPGQTALEIGTAAVVGAGMKLMASAGGNWSTAAKVSGLFLGLAATSDLLSRGASTSAALYDNWNNPQNYFENKARIAGSLGAAAFDYALVAGAGALGSLSANLISDSLKPTPPAPTGDPDLPPEPKPYKFTHEELERLWYLVAGDHAKPPPDYWFGGLSKK